MRGLLLVLLLIYVAVCAFFYFQQDQMTFPAPAHYPNTTPLDAGIPFEDLHIPVNGSEQIHAWWIPASSSTGKVLLVMHGNGYVMEQGFTKDRARVEFVPLHQLGVNLLLIDYRGYGSSSPVPPSERHVYEDARAAFTYLTAQRKVPSRDIVIFGRSIGTGPAAELAMEHPEAGGLILMSPFTSLSDAAKAVWYLRALPLSLLVRNRFDNLSKIDAVHIPVLIAVGAEDDLTPPAMAQALFQKANEPKRMYLAPGASHNDMIDVGGQKLEDQIGAFLQTIH